MTTVLRAYRYRFTPTPEQADQLARTFGCVRYVYNHFLRERTDAWFERQERMGYNATAKALTVLKKQPDTAFLAEVSNVCLQQSLRHLDRAFANFFKGQARYPTFKKKRRKQSATYMANGFRWRDGQLWLAKQKDPLAIRWSRRFTGQPSSITVSLDTAGRYHVSFLVEEEQAALPVTPKMVGLDLGLTHRVITSDGNKIPNPRFIRQTERKLARAQRALSRKQRGSNNRAKARLKVARLHAKRADQRRDATHKLLQAGKAILVGADKLRHHENTVGHTGG